MSREEAQRLDREGGKAERKRKNLADSVYPPSDELFHLGRRARTLIVDKDNGMPSVGQILPYVLRLMASDRQWCLSGIRDHTVGQAHSTSIKPTSDAVLLLPKV